MYVYLAERYALGKLDSILAVFDNKEAAEDYCDKNKKSVEKLGFSIFTYNVSECFVFSESKAN